MTERLNNPDIWNNPGEIDMAALVDALDPSRHEPEVAYRFSGANTDREFYRPDDPYGWVD